MLSGFFMVGSESHVECSDLIVRFWFCLLHGGLLISCGMLGSHS